MGNKGHIRARRRRVHPDLHGQRIGVMWVVGAIFLFFCVCVIAHPKFAHFF